MPKLHLTPILFAVAGALLLPAAHAGEGGWTFGGFGTLGATRANA